MAKRCDKMVCRCVNVKMYKCADVQRESLSAACGLVVTTFFTAAETQFQKVKKNIERGQKRHPPSIQGRRDECR